MSRHSLRFLPVALCSVSCALLLSSSTLSAQTPWVQDWLREYFNGGQAAVATRLVKIANLTQLQDDLEKIAPQWLAQTGPNAGSARHAIAGFALEAAASHVDQASAASKLIEWGCRQVRRDPKPDEFDRRWHRAAIALLEGTADADALEAHLGHVRLQFPSETGVLLARGVAEELRVFTGMTDGSATASTTAKHGEEAVRRFQEASKDETTLAESGLRLGHALLQLGRADQALEALDRVEPATKDPDVIYLARLFRGRAFDRLGKFDDARRAYESALTTRRDGQAATTALAALLFRNGQRDEADRMTETMLAHESASDDPWWSYWPGDYRKSDRLIAAMREAMK